ncbi:MAG: histidine phosphatase family protein [Steroidobacteraceae bacterium]
MMPERPSSARTPLARSALAAILLAGTLIAAASLPIASATAEAADTPMAAASAASAGRAIDARQLARRLRAGGYVIVMRHASAPRTGADASAAEPDNPRHERQLDAAGKASARALGAALHALRIPIGPIYSSPTYRALETVRLAHLGMPQVVPQLAEGNAGMSGAADASQIEWLRHAVNHPPQPGSNSLIVTHTPNIVGAFGRGVSNIRAAEMLIFRPRPRAPADLVGRMTVGEWRALARRG